MGREVFLFALRRNAEPNNAETPGRVPKADLEPWYIADQLMRTEAEAHAGLARCVVAGLLREEEAFWLIAGWDEAEWGREKSTDRVRRWRAEKRSETLRNVPVTPVKRQETDETARSEERRPEEKRREESSLAPDGATTPPLLAGFDVLHDDTTGPEPKWWGNPKPPAKTKLRKRQLEDGWTPKPFAVPAGVSVTVEMQKFTDWARANARAFADWDAAWRNWLRKAAEINARSGPPRPPPKKHAIDYAREGYEKALREEAEGTARPADGFMGLFLEVKS